MSEKDNETIKVKKNKNKSNKVTNMSLAGHIDPFAPGSDFESYEDRVNQFLK